MVSVPDCQVCDLYLKLGYDPTAPHSKILEPPLTMLYPCARVCELVKASELTGSIPSADLPLTDTSHALWDHVAQLLQQRRDAIAVSLPTP